MATPDGQTATSPAATPSVPADLPTAAEGYQWFVAPASGFGRAAEIQFGDCFFSIVVFRPEGREDAEPAFQQAIRSLVVP